MVERFVGAEDMCCSVSGQDAITTDFGFSTMTLLKQDRKEQMPPIRFDFCAQLGNLHTIRIQLNGNDEY